MTGMLAAALIVAIGQAWAWPLGHASLAESGVIRVRLEHKVALARHANHPIYIQSTELERHRWSRFYVINAGTRREIDRILGFTWKNAPTEVPRGERDETLLVFTERRHVVAYTFYPDKRGRFDCLSNEAGWRRDLVFTVRFSPGTRSNPPTPVLTTVRDSEHQRECLKTFGIF